MKRREKPNGQGLLIAAFVALAMLLALLRLIAFMHGHGRHRL